MEKRVVIFLVLSLAIIFGYDLLLKKLGYSPLSESPPFGQPESAPLSDLKTTEDPSVSPSQERVVEKREVFTEQDSRAVDERIEKVDTPLYHAEITNRGAQVHSWQLKKYLQNVDEEPTPIEMVYSEGHFAGPLTVKVPDPVLSNELQQSLYEVDRDFSVLDETHPTGRLTFILQIPAKGIWIQKELTFHYDSYVVDVSVKLEGLSQGLDVLLGTNFGIVEWGQGFIGLLGPAWMIGDELEKETPDPEIQRTGDLRWAALQDKYFTSVMIPQGATGVFARTEAETVVSAGIKFPPTSGSQSYSLQLYAGPKQYDILKAFQIGLEDTIDFGWFIYGSWGIVKAVAKPLFYVLRFLYDFTHNYGLAIILLTMGIKVLFVPLQYKSYKSMQGMQQIQPKVVALQSKFKDDRERLNKELMKLYREHKVNPVGGCLPMFLQMPVFVALFNILYMTVDLRQAPFMLWISDLSVQDPFYVLPVLMGASMVLQQKIMPTTMDPTQAKMMLMLPVFLTFLFVTFPAGLVLYWLTNNVLTIAQQFITDRYVYKRPTFAVKSIEEAPPTQETKGSRKKKSRGEGNGKGDERATSQEKDERSP